MYVIKMLCQMFSLPLGPFCLSLKHGYHHEEFSRTKIGPYLSDSDRKKMAMAKITSDQLRDEVDRFLNDIGDVGNITIGGVPFFLGWEEHAAERWQELSTKDPWKYDVSQLLPLDLGWLPLDLGFPDLPFTKKWPTSCSVSSRLYAKCMLYGWNNNHQP